MQDLKEIDYILEIWNPIPGHKGLEASTHGRIRSVKRDENNPRIISQRLNNKGYSAIRTYVKGKFKNCSVHRLVAMAFLKNPHKFAYVNHKNRNRQDNRIENLEWCSASHNNKHWNIGKPKKIRDVSLNQLSVLFNGQD